MNKPFSLLTLTLALTVLARPASADELRESYTAVLSEKDHFNSSGNRLTNAAAIIRQDRANLHKFNQPDAGDEDDGFFANAANRDTLERLLERGKSTRRALGAIVNGTPTVTVRVYRSDAGYDYVTVAVR